MKGFVLLLVSFILCFNLYGQKNDTAYIHDFGGIQDDGCQQVEPTPDGGYILIGATNSFGIGYTSFYAIKTDSLCNFQWSKTYGGSYLQEGYSVASTLDSGFAFVGFTNSYGAGGYDVYLVRADSKGNTLWQKTYGGSNWDFGYCVKQLKDSGFIISGVTYSYGSGNGNMYIIRTDKNGDTLWTKTAGGTGYSTGNSIYILNDSIYVIAGGTTSYGTSDTNACIVKIKDCGDSGSIQSTTVYGKEQNSMFYSVRGTSDKGYVLNGSNDSINNTTVGSSFPYECEYKMDSAGAEKWIQLWNGSNYSAAIGKDAVQLSDGSLLCLSSESSFGAGGFDFYLHRIDIYGNWLQGISIGGAKNELAGSIAIGKNGDIVFAGCSNSVPLYSIGLSDVFMLRFKSTDTLPIPYDTVVYRVLDTTEWPAAIPRQQYSVGVKVFPNPLVSSSTIVVQGSNAEKYTINLFNIEGECVISEYPLKNIGHGQSVALLQRGNLSSGEYSYEIIANGNTKVASGKIIVD